MPSMKKISLLLVGMVMLTQVICAEGTASTVSPNVVYPDLTQYNLTTNVAPLISSSSTNNLNFIGKFDLLGGAIETSQNIYVGLLPETATQPNQYVRMISLGSTFAGDGGSASTNYFNTMTATDYGEMALNYPAYINNGFDGQSDLRPLIFDVYPGTSNIVEQGNAYISFKYTPSLVTGMTINVVVSSNTYVYTVQNQIPAGTGIYSISRVDLGDGINAILLNGVSINSGTSVRVSIYGDRLYGGQELITFNFLVAGAPFLGKTVSGNTSPISINAGLSLEPQLYGWSAAGNADINGDGINDTVVSDPYFRYSASSYDTDRTGIVYVYFGRIDRVDPITKGMAPDMVLQNNVAGQTLYKADESTYEQQALACREFGYLVKLADINKDGYADIIVGQPSYDTNRGRILIYYGGPAIANSLSTLNPYKPSVILSNRQGVGDNLPSGNADLVGAMFDVGDLEGDGYSDVVFRRGDAVDYIKGKVIAAAAYDTRVQVSPIVLDLNSGNGVKTVGMAANQRANRDSYIAFVGNFHGQNDGSNDLAISVPVSSNNSTPYSTVYVYYGQDFLDSISSVLPSNKLQDLTFSNCWFGWSISAGRINNDPFMDIIVGKRTEPGVTQDKGKVILFMGGQGLPYDMSYNEVDPRAPGSSTVGVYGLLEPIASLYTNNTATITNNRVNQFGYTVVCVGDLDGDRIDDFMVGAPYHGDSDVGAVYIFLGNNGLTYPTGFNDIKKYVLTGTYANAHYGLNISPLGFFDGAGYSSVLISAPGFKSYDPGFAGFRTAEGNTVMGVSPVSKHTIDVYANTYGIDTMLPFFMAVDTSVKNGEVGVNPAARTTIYLADRGQAGLDINSFKMDVYKYDGVHKGRICAGNLTDFSGFVTGSNIAEFKLYAKGYGDVNWTTFNIKEMNPLTTLQTSYTPDNRPLYSFVKPMQLLKVEFAPASASAKNVFGDKPQTFYYDITIGDMANSLVQSAPWTNQINKKVFFTTQFEPSAKLADNPPVNYSQPRTYTTVPIGDYNNDGRVDFAYRGDNNTVYVFYGEPGLDIKATPDLTINCVTPGESFFGKTIASIARYGSDPATLVIGSNQQVYFIPYNDNLMQSRYAGTEKSVVVAYDESSVPIGSAMATSYKVGDILNANYYVRTLKTKFGKEYAVIAWVLADGSLSVSVRNSVGGIDHAACNYNVALAGVTMTPAQGITALDAGYFNTIATQYQQIAVGLGGANGRNGAVAILDIDPANGPASAPRIIRNTSMSGAGFGESLSAGYFKGGYEQVVDAGSLTGYSLTTNASAREYLAIGSPYAAAYGANSGLVFVLPPEALKQTDRLTRILQSTSTNIVVPEVAEGQFGLSLASARFISSPEHYALWNDVNAAIGPYYDNADDLIIGAAEYHTTWNIAGDIVPHYVRGKTYVYRGDPTGLKLIPERAWSMVDNAIRGLYVSEAGDILDTRNDVFFACGDRAVALVNLAIPDNSPPVIFVQPDDHSFDVTLNSSITINLSSASGIAEGETKVYRVVDNSYQLIYANSEIQTSYTSIFSAEVIKVSDTLQQLIIKPKTNWRESEIVELLIQAASNRKVTVQQPDGSWKDMNAPVIASVQSGFVTAFKPNTANSIVFMGNPESNSFYGTKVVNLGDINNDTYREFAISEPGYSDGSGVNTGKVYVYSAEPSRLGSEIQSRMTSIVYGLTTANIYGSARFGWNVAPAGDMSGSGYKGMAVAAANTGLNGSEVYVFMGNDNPQTLGENPGLNGWMWNTEYLHYGAISIQSAQAGDRMGEAMSSGDLNGDGYDDLVIGAPYSTDSRGKQYAGRVYVVFGRQEMQDYGRFARSAARLGQGSASYQGPIKLSDAVDLLTCTSLPLVGYIDIPGLVSENTGYYQFGSSVAVANISGKTVTVSREIHGNTYESQTSLAQILVGAPGYGEGRGKVYVFSLNNLGGKFEQLATTKALQGEKTGDRYGAAIAAVGDITGRLQNGKTLADDFVVGAPGYDVSFALRSDIYRDAGAAYVYGVDSVANSLVSLNQVMVAYGQNTGDYFGSAVGQVGNVNNNTYGVNNIAVAAPLYDAPGLTNAGRVYIFGTDLYRNAGVYTLKMSGYPDFVASGTQANAQYGFSFTGLGDTDDDYVPEYLVAAPGMTEGTGTIGIPGVSAVMGNVGKVFLFRNPDLEAPYVFEKQDTISNIYPFPGDKKAVLAELQLVGATEFRNYRPISFDIADDRAVKLDSVVMVLAETKRIQNVQRTTTRNYAFAFDSTGMATFLQIDRKRISFGLNLRERLSYRTTYNATIYATDKMGNTLKYLYTGVDPFGATNNRVPIYSNTDPQAKPYFQFSFITSSNPFAEPDIELWLEGKDKNNLPQESYRGYIAGVTANLCLVAISDAYNIVSVNLRITPLDAALIVTAGYTPEIVFNQLIDIVPPTPNYYPPKSQHIVDFSRGSFAGRDGIMKVEVSATDSAPTRHTGVKTEYIVYDVQPPTLNLGYPLQGATNVPDDAVITFSIRDAGTGVSINTVIISLNVQPSGSMIVSSSQLVKDVDYTVTINNPEGYNGLLGLPPGAYCPELQITIKNKKFFYEDQVTISMYAQDNAGRIMNAAFGYTVSPDYRPPYVYADSLYVFEQLYTTKNLTVSINAWDDTAVAQAVFTVIEAQSDADIGLATLPNSVGVTRCVINIATPTQNYEGFHQLFFRSLIAGETSGTAVFGISFIDKRGNESAMVTTSIMIAPKSVLGGPIMPMVIASPYGAYIKPPSYRELTRYVNTRNIDLWLFAADEVIRPTQSYTPMVNGFVVGLYTSQNVSVPFSSFVSEDLKRSERLLPYNIGTELAYNYLEDTVYKHRIDGAMVMDRAGRTYRKLSVSLPENSIPEGELTFYANFVDNDNNAMDFIGTDSNGLTLGKYLFSNYNTDVPKYTISPTAAWVALNNPINLAPLDQDGYSWGLAQRPNWCDNPVTFSITYDTVKPSLNGVLLYGRVWREGLPVNNSLYTKDYSGLALLANFTDKGPINELYYQVVCVTNNNQLLVVETNMSNRNFTDEVSGLTWLKTARYRAYDQSIPVLNSLLYIAKPASVNNNAITINGDTSVTAEGFVTDDMTTGLFEATNKANWTKLDLRRNAPADNFDTTLGDGGIFLPIPLRSDATGYYVRVCITDAAGNYSPIMVSNLVTIDAKEPDDVSNNMRSGLKLNRRFLNMGFADNASGLYSIEVKTPTMSNLTQILNSDQLSSNIFVNGVTISRYPTSYTKRLDLTEGFWDRLSEGEVTLRFLVRDSVSNERGVDINKPPKTTDVLIIKDTTPIGLSLQASGTGLLTLSGNYYTVGEAVTLSSVGQITETHSLILTKLPQPPVVTQPVDPTLVFSATPNELSGYADFSLEIAGDTEKDDALLLPLVNSADARVTTHITFLEQKVGLSNKHYIGNYAQKVSFNIIHSGVQPYVWPGLSTTVDISNQVNQIGTTNFTVGVLLNISALGQQHSSITADGDPIGAVEDGTGAKLGGCFVLSVSVNGTEYYSDKQIVKVSGSWPDWSLLTVSFTVLPPQTAISINIKHSRFSDVTVPFSFNAPAELVGAMLVDGLFVVPGEDMVTGQPYVFSSAQSKSYALPYSVIQGRNTFVYGVFDDVGNLATSSIMVVRDNTAPTFAPQAGFSAVTTSIDQVALLALPRGNTVYYQKKTGLLDTANGVSVNIATSPYDGITYVNSYDVATTKSYMSAVFIAQDEESPITKYRYQLYKIDPLSGLPVADSNSSTKNAIDLGDGKQGVIVDQSEKLEKGQTYLYKAWAVNVLGLASEPITTNELRIDIDAPTVSVTYSPSIADTGWYTGPITVTVSALDVCRLNNGDVVSGGVGVTEIYVITNNNTVPARFDVSYGVVTDSLKVITFELNEDAANSFTVYAADALGQLSQKVTVTKNLNIDRIPPQSKFLTDTGVNYTDQLDSLFWLNKEIGFKLSYSDGLGVGTSKLYWTLDGVSQSPIIIDSAPLGQFGTVGGATGYYSREAGKFITRNNVEGMQGGYFLQSIIDADDAVTMINAGIISPQGSPLYYYWTNRDRNNRSFVNEDQLITVLQGKNLKDYSRVLNAWRFGTPFAAQAVVGDAQYYPIADQSLAIDALQMAFKKDGYHIVTVQLADKLGNTSNVTTYSYFCIDTRPPEIRINLGGNFQREWSLNPVSVDIQAYDVFSEPVLFDSQYYTTDVWNASPEALRGLTITRPGSGVKQIAVTLNGLPTAWDNIQADPDQRFDMFLYAIYNPQKLVITKNGLNYIGYRVTDWSGNESEYLPGYKGAWSPALNSYLYEGAKGVIYGIKVDTLPPHTGFLTVLTTNYTDNLKADNRSYDPYVHKPYYTNKRQIEFAFGAKDDGIGVRYGYVSENTGFGLDVSVPDVAPFMQVASWNVIAGYYGSPLPADPYHGEQGIIAYTNTRSVYLTTDNGPRTLNIAFADDFGLNYFVKKASLEDVSITFDISVVATSENQVNLIPDDILQSGKFSWRLVDGSSTDMCYYWNGKFDVPPANFGVGDQGKGSQSEGSLLGDPINGYTIQQITLNRGESIATLNVYVWNQQYVGRADHRSIIYEANSAIFYDDRVSLNQPLAFSIDELFVDVINDPITGDILVTNNITVQFQADETDEDSGITYVMFGGDIDPAKCSANVWIPYDYHSPIPVAYRLAIKVPTQDTWLTVNVVGVKDRAGNEAGTINKAKLLALTSNNILSYLSQLFVNTQYESLVLRRDVAAMSVAELDTVLGNMSLLTPEQRVSVSALIVAARDQWRSISFFYDRPMPRDNLKSRIWITDMEGNEIYRYQTDGGLYSQFNKAEAFQLHIRVPNVNAYDVSVNIMDSGIWLTPVSISSGNSLADDVVLNCAFNGAYRGDGTKYIGLILRDRGTGPSSEIVATCSFAVDSTPPTIHVTGIDTAQFYSEQVTFNLEVIDLDSTAVLTLNASGIQRIEMKINEKTYVWDSQTYANTAQGRGFDMKQGIVLKEFEQFNGQAVQTGVRRQLSISNTSRLNRLEIKAYDRLNNEMTLNITDIQVNATPPQLYADQIVLSGLGASGNLEYVEGKPAYFVNTDAPELKFSGRGTTFTLTGDLRTTITDQPISDWSSYVPIELTDTEDGTKNVFVRISDGFTLYGGPSANSSITFYLDRRAPFCDYTNNPALINTAEALTLISDQDVLTGNINDPLGLGGYASGAKLHIYGNDNREQIVTPTAGVWSISLLDLLQADGTIPGTHTLTLKAIDKAMNKFSEAPFNITVSDNYVIKRGQTNVNKVTIQRLSKDSNMFTVADSTLTGVKSNTGLDNTIHDFLAYDDVNNPVHVVYGTGSMELVLRYSVEAALQSDPANFRVYYLNGDTWELVGDQQVVDKTARTLTVPVQHFSVYRIFATVPYAQNLKDVHVYPNPYKGSDDDKFNGDDSDPNYNKVIFENITKTAKIRIYTISGELVRTIESGKSQALWDLNNDQGQKVASGIYLLLITDQDNNRHMGRLTIVR